MPHFDKHSPVIKVRRPPSLASKLEAFSFQAAAVQAIQDEEYGAIFHEQGLGKTKISIDLALNWLERDIVDSVLVVTKRSLVENWKNELKQHTFLTPRVLVQDRTANFNAFNSPSRLYLTHYEVLESEKSRFDLFLKTRRVGVLLDESQKIKTPSAALTQAVLSLSSGFRRRFILTGTPVANRPYDLWAQIYFLDGGKALGTDYKQFKATLDLRNDLATNHERRDEFESDLSEVFQKISAFTVRETKKSAGIELPGKTITNVECEMEDRQSEIYENYKADLRSLIVKGGLPVIDDADDILKRLLRLVQVASNPAMLDESYRRKPGKVPILENIVHDIVDKKEKAIVWTSFVDNARWLAREMRDYGCVVVNGNVSIDGRNAALARFKSDAECRLLIATPGSAKEGLTLTVANHAIFFDRTFSLDDYLQAQDRIHRISQDRECYVYNLISRDTVDEWVDALMAAKHSAAQLAQGDITLREFRLSMSYNFGELLRGVLNLDDRDSSSVRDRHEP